jgi:hypothetical protein
VKYQTLISWIKKEKQPSTPTTPDASPSSFFSLVPALIEGSGTSAASDSMEISLPGGARLSITSAHHVALAAETTVSNILAKYPRPEAFTGL